jgi:signal transduction histidine kinase
MERKSKDSIGSVTSNALLISAFVAGISSFLIVLILLPAAQEPAIKKLHFTENLFLASSIEPQLTSGDLFAVERLLDIKNRQSAESTFYFQYDPSDSSLKKNSIVSDQIVLDELLRFLQECSFQAAEQHCFSTRFFLTSPTKWYYFSAIKTNGGASSTILAHVSGDRDAIKIYLSSATFVGFAVILALSISGLIANLYLQKRIGSQFKDLAQFVGDDDISRLCLFQSDPSKSAELSAMAAVFLKHDKELKQKQAEILIAEKAAAVSKTTQNIAEHIIHDLKSPLDAFERVTTVQSWKDFQSAKTVFSSALFRIHSILNGLRLGELEKVVRPHPSHLSLQELANEIAAFANKFGVTIECETPEVPDAYIDHPKAQRVVANLLRNGIECGSKTVRLFCKNSENDLVICVADNGPGVPADFVPKLFARGATLGKQNGSGFGLSYAHEVALGHAGSITHDRHDGWTVFELRFPEALQNTRVAIPQEIAAEQNTAELAPKLFLFLKNSALQKELTELFAERGIDCSETNGDLSSQGVCIVYGDQELIPEAMFAGKNRILIANPQDVVSNTVAKIQRILKMHTKGIQT